VIKKWTDVAVRVRLYMLTCDLTSLVRPQFSHWLKVRRVGTVEFIFIFIIIFLTFAHLMFGSRMNSPVNQTNWFFFLCF